MSGREGLKQWFSCSSLQQLVDAALPQITARKLTLKLLLPDKLQLTSRSSRPSKDRAYCFTLLSLSPTQRRCFLSSLKLLNSIDENWKGVIVIERLSLRKIMEKLMPNSTHTVGCSIFSVNDDFYASVPVIAVIGSILFLGMSGHMWYLRNTLDNRVRCWGRVTDQDCILTCQWVKNLEPTTVFSRSITFMQCFFYETISKDGYFEA